MKIHLLNPNYIYYYYLLNHHFVHAGQVLVVLVGGLSYSITAVQYFAAPQYVIPADL